MTTLFLIILMLLPLEDMPKSLEKEWRVTRQSTLSIAGSSNVNQFECFSLTYAGADRLSEYLAEDARTTTLNGTIKLQAAGFDCRNSIMTQDLKKTIMADEHPEIKVRFLSLQRSLRAGKQVAKGVVEITLVGVSRQYQIETVFTDNGRGHARLQGSWEFSFTDFNLDPPTKMMGAIRVKDCLTVNFKLELQEMEARVPPKVQLTSF